MQLDDIVKPVPSRTMSSMMASIKQNDPTDSPRSDLDVESQISDESESKDNLLKTLKFSSDILQQMNAKRQEIVGGRKNSLGAHIVNTTSNNIGEDTELNRRRSSLRREIETGHIEIGGPLPQMMLPKSTPEIDNAKNHVKNPKSVNEINEGSLVKKIYPANCVGKTASIEDIDYETDVILTTDLNIASMKQKNSSLSDIVQSSKENTRDFDKNEGREMKESTSKQSYVDQIHSFELTLEEDMIKKKSYMMEKFNKELEEEMKLLADQRLEKLKTYEAQMTKKLQKELEEFKDAVKKELEEKKREIMSNQESLLNELAQNATMLPNPPSKKQSVQNGDSNGQYIKEDNPLHTKSPKPVNPSSKDVRIPNNIVRSGRNGEFLSESNHHNPFTRRLEDLEKDIHKLRTQMGAVTVGGSISDYSSISDEPIQKSSNYFAEQPLSPDIDSFATCTDDEELNVERFRMRHPHRDTYEHSNNVSWGKQGREHDQRIANPYMDENVVPDCMQDYSYMNRGKHIISFHRSKDISNLNL